MDYVLIERGIRSALPCKQKGGLERIQLAYKQKKPSKPVPKENRYMDGWAPNVGILE